MSKLFKSKFFLGVAIVAVLAVAGVATSANAQTMNVTASAYTYSGVMKVGMSGPGISTLQAALNSVQTLQIVVDGAFGPATRAAVMQFQASHGLVADGVVGPMTGAALTAATVAVITIPTGLPAGCTSTAGFSPISGVKCSSGSSLPAGCTSTSGFSTVTGLSCSSGSSPSPSSSATGGETSIESFDLNDAEDTDLEEGANEAEVAEIEFDVEDADAELDRADIIFASAETPTANEEDKPWKVFDTVYIMNGSDTIAEMASDDQDDWSETDTDDVYRIRFSNIGEVFDEGDSVTLTVAVDVASTVDGADTANAADWDVLISSGGGDSDGATGGYDFNDDGLRFTDSEGIDTFIGEGDAPAQFDIEESGGDNAFDIGSSDNDPDATSLEVDDNNSSSKMLVFAFEVEADEDSTEDLMVEDFSFDLTVGNPAGGDASITQDDVIDEVTVKIDGNEFDADAPAGDTDDTIADSAVDLATYAADIEDDDFVVAPGDTVTVEVWVKFHSQTSAYDNGTTIFGAVDDSDFEGNVVGVDSDEDVAAGEVEGGTTGETHSLFTEGVVASSSSFDFEVTTVTDAGLISKQTFVIDFDVTAFGDTFYIPKPVVRGDDGTDLLLANAAGLNYIVETSAGVAVTNASTDVGSAQSALTSTADTVGGMFEIQEGDTETFTVTIELNDTGDTAGFYHIQLAELAYDTNQADDGTEAIYVFAPAQDYETDDYKVD